jgi:GMP synthase (glutamine-hydrolysing)
VLFCVNTEPDPQKTGSLDNLIKGLGRLGKKGYRVIHLRQAEPDWLREQGALGIIYSGSGALWDEYTEELIAPTRRLLQRPPCPVMGICGGHQLMGVVLGARCAPMRCSKPEGEPYTHEDCEGEQGYCSVKVRLVNILFTGLRPVLTVRQSHFEELKAIPPGFLVTAWNSRAAIQAMCHRSLPLFGTQFHPEHFTEECPDGARIVMNFLQYCAAKR